MVEKNQGLFKGRKFRGSAMVLLVSVLTGVFVAAGVEAAFAVSSAPGYSTVNGHQYINHAAISTGTSGSGSIGFTTDTKWNSGLPAQGWAGSRARLFNSRGDLVQQDSVFRYNDCAGCTAWSLGSRTGHGVWYSYGVSQGWTGSGYQAFYTFKTVNQNS